MEQNVSRGLRLSLRQGYLKQRMADTDELKKVVQEVFFDMMPDLVAQMTAATSGFGGNNSGSRKKSGKKPKSGE